MATKHRRRKELDMLDMIKTDRRIYKVRPDGTRALAHPAGALIPKDEYERLTGTRAAKPAPPKAAKPLDRLNRDELIAYAADNGVTHAEDATKAQIKAAITKAQG